MRAAQETCSRAGSIIDAIIHIGPAIAATAGIARSVNIPRGSRTASSARQVELTGPLCRSTSPFFEMLALGGPRLAPALPAGQHLDFARCWRLGGGRPWRQRSLQVNISIFRDVGAWAAAPRAGAPYSSTSRFFEMLNCRERLFHGGGGTSFPSKAWLLLVVICLSAN